MEVEEIKRQESGVRSQKVGDEGAWGGGRK
jgi:hypothetical protein